MRCLYLKFEMVNTNSFCMVKNAPQLKKRLIRAFEKRTNVILSETIKRALMTQNWKETFYRLCELEAQIGKNR